MGDNVWMASEGLDIDFSDQEKKVLIPSVKINSLFGTLISLESNRIKVSFQCKDIQEALSFINKRINDFVVEYETFSLTQRINEYNYKVTINGASAIVVLEEVNSHEK